MSSEPAAEIEADEVDLRQRYQGDPLVIALIDKCDRQAEEIKMMKHFLESLTSAIEWSQNRLENYYRYLDSYKPGDKFIPPRLPPAKR